MKLKRLLTKSHFKLAAECPTKLYYTGKPHLYRNLKQEDSFLAMLADGGYQVGLLAKCFYPNGIEISSSNSAEAEEQTQELLKLDQVVLFEPAMTLAVVDRLVHHSTILEMNVESYRRRAAQAIAVPTRKANSSK